MKDTHANPLYFHDNPSLFVTIRGDPTGQETGPSPLLVLQIPSTHEMRKKKTTRML